MGVRSGMLPCRFHLAVINADALRVLQNWGRGMDDCFLIEGLNNRQGFAKVY